MHTQAHVSTHISVALGYWNIYSVATEPVEKRVGLAARVRSFFAVVFFFKLVGTHAHNGQPNKYSNDAFGRKVGPPRTVSSTTVVKETAKYNEDYIYGREILYRSLTLTFMLSVHTPLHLFSTSTHL